MHGALDAVPSSARSRVRTSRADGAPANAASATRAHHHAESDRGEPPGRTPGRGFQGHLDEFDRRRAFLELGHDSLWSYCLRALRLREGPADRRIGAMRVLRRFPALEAPLRDGRLCLSTVTLLGPLLTTDTLDDDTNPPPGREPFLPRSVVRCGILCRRHNALHAAQVFGREHMARFETRSLIPG